MLLIMSFTNIIADLMMTPSNWPASECSMVSALIGGGEGQQQCPNCGCQYDLGKQRKLKSYWQPQTGHCCWPSPPAIKADTIEQAEAGRLLGAIRKSVKKG